MTKLLSQQKKLELIQKYNVRGPRYTSYPPANHFHENFSTADFFSILNENLNDSREKLSLYIHIPFCKQICHFCACNSILKPQNSTPVEQYVEQLLNEIKSRAEQLPKHFIVGQIHWGGGTPNAIERHHIEAIMTQLFSSFSIDKEAEIAMECNPAYLDRDDLSFLRNLGFNRLSLGIQDFNPQILEVVNRKPSKLEYLQLTEHMRNLGLSFNFDLIYGLPTQTLNDFEQSVEQAIALRPNRVATFSYAHVPWVKGIQKLLEKYPRAEQEEKISMLLSAKTAFEAAGYIAVGMDHFALPEDPLAIALQENKLSRNFQGYTHQYMQVLAFGASAISQFDRAYIQNHRSAKEYIQQMKVQNHAYVRAYKLNENEVICRELIAQIMCNTHIDLKAISEKHGISLQELRALANNMQWGELEKDQLIVDKGDTLEITPTGRFFVRNMAMACDPGLESKSEQYSKTI